MVAASPVTAGVDGPTAPPRPRSQHRPDQRHDNKAAPSLRIMAAPHSEVCECAYDHALREMPTTEAKALHSPGPHATNKTRGSRCDR